MVQGRPRMNGNQAPDNKSPPVLVDGVHDRLEAFPIHLQPLLNEQRIQERVVEFRDVEQEEEIRLQLCAHVAGHRHDYHHGIKNPVHAMRGNVLQSAAAGHVIRRFAYGFPENAQGDKGGDGQPERQMQVQGDRIGIKFRPAGIPFAEPVPILDGHIRTQKPKRHDPVEQDSDQTVFFFCVFKRHVALCRLRRLFSC